MQNKRLEGRRLSKSLFIMLDIIINKEKEAENIILVENGKMLEHYLSSEEDKKKRLEGNIYAAKVGDIMNGMQAAFVDFGGIKKGFIHLKDSLPRVDVTKNDIDYSKKITSILKPNQKLLVQIKKDSDLTKGARVSTHINLTGKYIVLMPNTSFITVSQKIENKEKQKELKKLLKAKLPKEHGAIIRTSSENATKEQIEEDLNKLLKKWKDIEEKFNKCEDYPKLILESDSIVEKMITDLSQKKIDQIFTNDEAEYKKISSKYKDSGIKIILEKNKDLLEMYDLKDQIEKNEKRKIWLNCGGFITIDKTEALTAIDVNTGKYTGKKDLESTIYKVNKEATVEIAKQLRLRDIGGIIIIDYIDMKDNENKRQIENLLKEELKKDRAKTQVEGFTKLNLMELTRKHICGHLITQD